MELPIQFLLDDNALELTGLEDQKEELQAQIESLKAQLETAKESQVYKKLAAEHEEIESQLSKELDGNARDLSTLADRKEKLEAQVLSLEADLKIEREKLKSKEEEVRLRVKERQESNRKIGDERREEKKKREKVEKDLAAVRVQLEELRALLQKAENNEAAMEHKLDESEMRARVEKWDKEWAHRSRDDAVKYILEQDQRIKQDRNDHHKARKRERALWVFFSIFLGLVLGMTCLLNVNPS